MKAIELTKGKDLYKIIGHAEEMGHITMVIFGIDEYADIHDEGNRKINVDITNDGNIEVHPCWGVKIPNVDVAAYKAATLEYVKQRLNR